MIDRPRPTLPWLVVVASVMLAVLLLYTLFAGYLPARQRVGALEAELKTLYAREAELHARVAALEAELAKPARARASQLRAVIAERDRLAQRVKDLERQLASRRRAPARAPASR